MYQYSFISEEATLLYSSLHARNRREGTRAHANTHTHTLARTHAHSLALVANPEAPRVAGSRLRDTLL